jgi:uncharacterized pyridoxamine 5'-phosphate oxidase family protein
MKEHNVLSGLFESQKLAVLATESNGKPHNCLVAFAHTDDLKHLLFATRRDTRKFRDVATNPNVSILIDNRSNGEEDFEKAIAVTAKGIAHELGSLESGQFIEIYIARHPYLKSFIADDDVAILKIEISEYLTARFDSTEVIHPG